MLHQHLWNIHSIDTSDIMLFPFTMKTRELLRHPLNHPKYEEIGLK